MATSEFSDWWDTQHQEYQELLQEYVDENPTVLRVGLATLATIPTSLGAGLVDALRFGEGFAEGGADGVAKDALRLLALAGPLGKVSRYLVSLQATRLAIHLKDPAAAAGICTWVAVTKALRHTAAGNLFAKVDELAALMGKNVPAGQLPSLWADDLVPVMRMMGAKVKDLGRPLDMGNLMRTAQDTLGRYRAMIFAVEWKMPGGQLAQHTLYMFKDGLGRLRISDRTGHVVKTLAEYEKLVPSWKGIANAWVFNTSQKGSMLLLEGPQMLYLDTLEKLSSLMIPLVGLVAINTEEVQNVQELDARFRAYVSAKKGGNPVQPPAMTSPVPPGQLPPIYWLTGVQARLKYLGFYSGDVHGNHDSASKKAVMAFQTANPPLRVDGIPGPKTQAQLKIVYGS